MENENVFVSEETAERLLNEKTEEAKALLKDRSKLDEFLESLERKLTSIPKIGPWLANVPVFAEMVKYWVSKTYTAIPAGTIVAALGALIYFVLPIDLFPDGVPLVGYVDDAAVLLACSKLIESDLTDFKNWRKQR